MADSGGFVGVIKDFASPSGFQPRPISFVGSDQVALLPQGEEASARYATVLAILQRIHRPVYLQLQASLVRSVSIPSVGRVLSLRSSSSGDVEVQLDRCASRPVLKADQPGKIGLLESLTDSLDHGVIVATTFRPHSHEILDVRRAPAAAFGVCTPLTKPEPSQDAIQAALVRVDASKVDDFVRDMSTGACHLPGPAAGCIAFTYVDNECWAKAHKMCALLKARAISAAKIWIYAPSNSEPLNAYTANSATCHTAWSFHVAPIVRVLNGDLRVVDPSLFPTASVLKDDWVSAMRVHAPRTKFSDVTTYCASTPADRVPEYCGELAKDLDEAVAQLLLLAPPPPYACTPP